MRRWFSIVVNGLCVVSLLLCIGTAVLWARSYRTSKCFQLVTDYRYQWVLVTKGAVAFRSCVLPEGSPSWYGPQDSGFSHWSQSPAVNADFGKPMSVRKRWAWGAFAFDAGSSWDRALNERGKAGTAVSILIVPAWSVVLLTAIAPAIAASLHARRRRQPPQPPVAAGTAGGAAGDQPQTRPSPDANDPPEAKADDFVPFRYRRF